MSISKKFLLVGVAGLVGLNPLSTNLIADALVTAINTAMKYLVLGSGYIMVVSGTLVGVGALLMYTEYKQAEVKRLKKMSKNAKSSVAGEFLEE